MVPGFTPTATSGSRDGLIALAIAGLVAATVLIAHLAPSSSRPGPVSPALDETCAEWSDGCRVCQRSAQGEGCSTPGIACVPGASQCLRRAGG